MIHLLGHQLPDVRVSANVRGELNGLGGVDIDLLHSKLLPRTINSQLAFENNGSPFRFLFSNIPKFRSCSFCVFTMTHVEVLASI